LEPLFLLVFNKQINIVIDADVSLRSAMQVLTTADTSTTLINMAYGTCQKQIEINEFRQCVRNQSLIAKGATTLLTGAWPTANTGTTNGDRYQQEIDRWKAYSESTLTNTFKIDDLVVAQEAPGVTQATSVSQITGFDNTVELRRTILSFRGAFLYIIEIMMLVTALIRGCLKSLVKKLPKLYTVYEKSKYHETKQWEYKENHILQI
jgi:hypothetical protein